MALPKKVHGLHCDRRLRILTPPNPRPWPQSTWLAIALGSNHPLRWANGALVCVQAPFQLKREPIFVQSNEPGAIRIDPVGEQFEGLRVPWVTVGSRLPQFISVLRAEGNLGVLLKETP